MSFNFSGNGTTNQNTGGVSVGGLNIDAGPAASGSSWSIWFAVIAGAIVAGIVAAKVL